MLLLAIDTSTSAITVALHDGADVVGERSTLDARGHAEHLAPNIHAVLHDAGAEPADVTTIVTGTGPGPFTGLRVGIVTAVTMAHALDVPVAGLCSLDAVAHAGWLAGIRGQVLVATDARRKEVYHAPYALDEGRAHREAEPLVARAQDLPADLRDRPVLGRGPLLYPELLARPDGLAADALLDVSAGAMADLAARRIAAGLPLESTQPLYLRRPDAAPAPAPTLGGTRSALG